MATRRVGALVGYDDRVGGERFGEDERRSDYSSHLWRAMFEMRWYSRAVSAGGLYLALRGGVMWMTDRLSPVDDEVEGTRKTQLAPAFGAAVGGVFVPYEGLGTTVALQALIASFPDEGPELGRDFGRAYGYGELIVVGATFGAALSVGL